MSVVLESICRWGAICGTFAICILECCFLNLPKQHIIWSDGLEWCFRQTSSLQISLIRAHLSTSSLKTLHCTPVVSNLLFCFFCFSCWCTCWNLKLLYFCICHPCAMWGLAIAALPWVCQCVQLNCIYVTNNTKKKFLFIYFSWQFPHSSTHLKQRPRMKSFLRPAIQFNIETKMQYMPDK